MAGGRGREGGGQSQSAMGPSSTAVARPLSLEEMRAAVAALRGGASVLPDAQHDETSTDAAVGPPVPPWTDATNLGGVVLVLPGHAGAGASTVAVALAEALARGRKVQLVEYADPLRSGLLSASSHELGTVGPWRRGRRGELDVWRLVEPVASCGAPYLPDGDDPHRWSVVEAGAPLISDWLASSDEVLERVQHVVVTTRLTVPAVRQTEHLLEAISGPVFVAALGPFRWPRLVEAGCGPRLRELRGRGHVVRVPIDRRLATSGLTGDSLPAAVEAAGRSLAALVAPQLPAQHRHRPQAKSSRRTPAGTVR